MSEETIPLRKDIPASDKWDLTALYVDDRDCKADFDEIPALTERVLAFKGHLSDSPEKLLEALKAREAADRTTVRITDYVHLLKNAGDDVPEWLENGWSAIHQYYATVSFFDPELCAMADDTIQSWIQGKAFDDYRVYIQKLLHNKLHIQSEKEESFHIRDYNRQMDKLKDEVDKELGSIHVDGKDIPLTNRTFDDFMKNPDRAVRKEAASRFFAAFIPHADTIVNIYAGLVKENISHARERRYKSSLEAALYKDNVPVSVYTNLIATVSANLAPLHKYYSFYKRVLALDELHRYDINMPLVPEPESKTSYEEAVEIVRSALAPLGREYTDLLCGGLLGGWCDRYENKGKRTDDYECFCYDGLPFIHLNYKESDPFAVYKMAHEGGHAMHNWYSVRNNPFMSYCHATFEAEVASTFNEELLFQYLMKNAKDDTMKKYLLSQRVVIIRGCLYRITMSAEFELAAFKAGEAGYPLSTDALRTLYRGILEKYNGPEMVLEEGYELERLTGRDFYTPFGGYNGYQYATGITAALALAKKVTEGGLEERDAYINFLKSGGSHYPLENLRIAGVDMETNEPFLAACDRFKSLVDQLDTLL